MLELRDRRWTRLALVAVTALGLGACDDDDGTGPDDLDDDEIVAVAMALNTGEVVTSEPAPTRAATEGVIDFAEMMITEHTAANQRLQALGIGPEQNTLSQQLTQTATALAQTLSALQGAAFDSAYIDAQVDLHETALETLEDVLIPEADNASLRAELQLMRTAVIAHLQLARGIQEVVG